MELLSASLVMAQDSFARWSPLSITVAFSKSIEWLLVGPRVIRNVG